MIVYKSLDQLPRIKNPVVTQGTFDGVHMAHQVVLQRLKEIAAKNDGETVVITFDPHPRMVLYPDDHGLKLLNTIDEKIKLLEEAGVDYLVIIPFTKEFSKLSSLQFINEIIVNAIHTKVLVIGYNHRFGKNREGAFEHLKEFSNVYGFEVEEIPEQDVDNVSVSSTKIRNFLQIGDVNSASRSLGRYYCISGNVIEGRKIGKELGFPTANIEVENGNKLIPPRGVYVVLIHIKEKTFRGMLNIGIKPTFGLEKESIEVNIFDFNEDVYNQSLRICFVDKIRDEVKFNSIDELKKQLENDKFRALEILSAVK